MITEYVLDLQVRQYKALEVRCEKIVKYCNENMTCKADIKVCLVDVQLPTSCFNRYSASIDTAYSNSAMRINTLF